MASILRNLHWIIILFAIVRVGLTWYEASEEIENRKQSIELQRGEIRKLEKTKKEIREYLENIDEEKQRIERVAVEIEKTQQLLPSEISDTENINLLRKIAEDVNIKEVSIAPEAEENRGFYIARRYKFKAKATYLQFLIMFEKISENKRILNTREVFFRKLEQPQRSKFQLIDGEFYLEAYRYNSNFKEDRGLDQIEHQFREKSTHVEGNAKGRKIKKGASE